MNRAWSILASFAVLLAPGPRGYAQTSGAASRAGAASSPRVLAHVLVLDFASADPNLGAVIAQNVRMRLARHGEYFVLDRLASQGLSPPVEANADPSAVRALLLRAGCDVAFCGTVARSGAAVSADVRAVHEGDAEAGAAEWRRQFQDTTERAGGLIAKAIVEALTSRPEWAPPQYGDEPEPGDFGRPINLNGGFDEGAKGWAGPDNVASFLEQGPAGRGTILRIRTDLARDPWLEYVRNLRLGLADANRPPQIARDTSYNSVAGLEGVHYRSDWLPARAGARYWLTADVKKSGGTPKIFVKGYRDWSDRADGLPELSMVERKLTPQTFAAMPEADRKKLIAEDAKAHPDRYRRECYRWFLHANQEGKDWVHYAAPFPPRGGLPGNVQWLQIQVYAYWPPGTYYFDNVNLYPDPRQNQPLPEEPARTQ